jgi:hypothetical protein
MFGVGIWAARPIMERTRMTLADKIPNMDKAALTILRANATRLQGVGSVKSEAAAELLLLIEAEFAKREAEKPAKVTKPRVKKVVEAVAE